MKAHHIPRTLTQTRPVSCANRAKSRSIFRSFALTAGLACLLPVSLLAKGHDDDNQDKKEGKGAPQHSGKGGSHQANPATQAARAEVPQGGKGRHQSAAASAVPQAQAYVPRATTRGATQNSVARVLPSQPAAQQYVPSGNRTRYSQQTQSAVQFPQPQGNRGNRYGGQWFPGDTHPDWGNSGEHYWNHHHYRWYDGGWLIITSGYSEPAYASGYDRGYSTRNSVARNVQRRLAAQGYYDGGIDGDIGPGSRRAIANYQDDHGLRATGRIDDNLLVSLGLE